MASLLSLQTANEAKSTGLDWAGSPSKCILEFGVAVTREGTQPLADDNDEYADYIKAEQN